jgi:menaquinol-cytochrome c reductase iron-sulfur subunit
LSSHAHAPGGQGAPRITGSYEPEPETPEEISRRKFMANATLAIGGLITLGLAIPIVGSLIPEVASSGESWTPLDDAGWKQLQASTSSAPVHIDITLHASDAYLPEQSMPQSVWGIKVKNRAKFVSDRPDLYTAGKDDLPYKIVTLGFVIFSPICPHLGCFYEWQGNNNRFFCPCHGSTYDPMGRHTGGPAARGLDPLPLREQSGTAQVEWIRYAPTVPDRIVVSYTD